MKINKIKLSDILLLVGLSILTFNIFDIRGFHESSYRIYYYYSQDAKILLTLSVILIFVGIKIHNYDKK